MALFVFASDQVVQQFGIWTLKCTLAEPQKPSGPIILFRIMIAKLNNNVHGALVPLDPAEKYSLLFNYFTD